MKPHDATRSINIRNSHHTYLHMAGITSAQHHRNYNIVYRFVCVCELALSATGIAVVKQLTPAMRPTAPPQTNKFTDTTQCTCNLISFRICFSLSHFSLSMFFMRACVRFFARLHPVASGFTLDATTKHAKQKGRREWTMESGATD